MEDPHEEPDQIDELTRWRRARAQWDDEGWDRDLVAVDPPFDSFLRLTSGQGHRRYDLIGRLANQLNAPKGRDLSLVAQQLIFSIYDLAVGAHQHGVLEAQKAEGYIRVAFERLERDGGIDWNELADLYRDFGLTGAKVMTTMATIDDDFEAALRVKLEPRVRSLIGRATGTSRPRKKNRTRRRQRLAS